MRRQDPLHRPIQTHSPPSHSPREAPGRPRAPCTAHQNLVAQALLLRDHFGIRPGERDLATFPLFAFFDPVWQATGVIPRMDFTRPGSVYPPRIIEPVLAEKVTHAFGSPALLDRVGRWGVERGVKSAHLETGPLGGCASFWPSARTFRPALGTRCGNPYALRGHRSPPDLLHLAAGAPGGHPRGHRARGRGVCVGRPLPQIRLEVMQITDSPIEQWSDSLRVPRMKSGELVVWGPMSRSNTGIAPRQRGSPRSSLRRAKSAIAPEMLDRLTNRAGSGSAAASHTA